MAANSSTENSEHRQTQYQQIRKRQPFFAPSHIGAGQQNTLNTNSLQHGHPFGIAMRADS